MKRIYGLYALVAVCLVVWPARRARAASVEVCLRVDQYQIAGPSGTGTVGPFGNPTPITMWGFIQTGTGPGCGFTTPAPAATANALPTPTVTAVEGDTLTIHLRNNLPAAGTPVYVAPPATVMAAPYSEPVSVIIPGQPSTLTPTWTDGTSGARSALGQRVRSFTQETPQQNATAIDYVFGPLKAGTYLIQSGTHPAVQLQMGLYGVLRVLSATVGQAYPNPTSAFDQETTLLFSEIDPVLHTAIASGLYGPAPAAPTPSSPPALLPPGWMTSTVSYRPRYFLINGTPFTASSLPTVIGATNQRVLIRFLNAGIATKVPLLQGQYVSIIAEDGNFLTASGFTAAQVAATCPAPRQQYSVLLPAGKVIDAILTTPASPVAIPVYDRRLNLTNNGATPGGMLALLTTTAGAATPPAPPPPCTIVGGAR
jgi:FtsP/CotA-like multicopper oxidase with cupredoxin domain